MARQFGMTGKSSIKLAKGFTSSQIDAGEFEEWRIRNGNPIKLKQSKPTSSPSRIENKIKLNWFVAMVNFGHEEFGEFQYVPSQRA